MMQHQEYFQALERLKSENSPITLKSVAVEAGRSPGAIKRNRESFSPLRAAIEEADNERLQRLSNPLVGLTEAKAKITELQRALSDAIGREIALLAQVRDLKQSLADIYGGKNIVPLRKIK